jgi:hypothetical protein
MTTTAKRFLFYLPRGICIFFAMFISIFALDVFEGHPALPELMLALLMHLIPTIALIIILIIAWRWEWVGAVLFPCLGLVYIFWAWGRFPLSVYLIIAGPLFLLGFLFLFNWLHHAELRVR